jgi:hypothetical protein
VGPQATRPSRRAREGDLGGSRPGSSSRTGSTRGNDESHDTSALLSHLPKCSRESLWRPGASYRSDPCSTGRPYRGSSSAGTLFPPGTWPRRVARLAWAREPLESAPVIVFVELGPELIAQAPGWVRRFGAPPAQGMRSREFISAVRPSQQRRPRARRPPTLEAHPVDLAFAHEACRTGSRSLAPSTWRTVAAYARTARRNGLPAGAAP